MADEKETNVNTGGGANIGGNASAGGNLAGRDQYNVNFETLLFLDNRIKQYEAVIEATRKGATNPEGLFFVGFDSTVVFWDTRRFDTFFRLF